MGARAVSQSTAAFEQATKFVFTQNAQENFALLSKLCRVQANFLHQAVGVHVPPESDSSPWPSAQMCIQRLAPRASSPNWKLAPRSPSKARCRRNEMEEAAHFKLLAAVATSDSESFLAAVTRDLR